MRFLVLIALATGLASWLSEARAQTYDYCRRGCTPERIAVLVDRSSAYQPEDVGRLHRGMQALRAQIDGANRIRVGDTADQAPPGAIVEIWPIVSYTAQSSPVFQGCLPNCPLSLSIFDSCRERKVREDRERFWTQIDEQLKAEILTAPSTVNGESPIVETIEKVVRRSAPNRLVVFSDFLEFHAAGNSLPQINFYSLNEGEWRRYGAALAKAGIRPPLASIKVTGFGFGREIGGGSRLSPRQGIDETHWRAVYKWWVGFLQENGAAGFVLDREYPGVAAPQAPPPDLPQDRRPN